MYPRLESIKLLLISNWETTRNLILSHLESVQRGSSLLIDSIMFRRFYPTRILNFWLPEVHLGVRQVVTGLHVVSGEQEDVLDPQLLPGSHRPLGAVLGLPKQLEGVAELQRHIEVWESGCLHSVARSRRWRKELSRLMPGCYGCYSLGRLWKTISPPDHVHIRS